MRLRLVFIGKTDDGPIKLLSDEYLARLGHFVTVRVDVLELPKNKIPKEPELQSQAEGRLLTEALKNAERVVLLDEGGKQFTSVGLAQHLQKMMNSGTKELTLVVGGAYGFAHEVRQQFTEKWALSSLTFTHQMVRAILAEQLYRAMSINNHGKYHH